MGLPSLNFQLRSIESAKSEEDEKKIRDVIEKSIFNDYITKIEVVDPAQIVDIGQDKSMRKSVKIMTD